MTILSALRDLTHREASPEDMAEFSRQIELQSNDRGAAILMGTNVDLALTSAIFHLIDPTLCDKLESDAGPLSSFSRRILAWPIVEDLRPGYSEQPPLHLTHPKRIAHAHVRLTLSKLRSRRCRVSPERLSIFFAAPVHGLAQDTQPPASTQEHASMIYVVCWPKSECWPWHARGLFEVPPPLIPEGHKLDLQRDPLPERGSVLTPVGAPCSHVKADIGKGFKLICWRACLSLMKRNHDDRRALCNHEREREQQFAAGVDARPLRRLRAAPRSEPHRARDIRFVPVIACAFADDDLEVYVQAIPPNDIPGGKNGTLGRFGPISGYCTHLSLPSLSTWSIHTFCWLWISSGASQ